jgi:hypothetical protein
LADSLPLAEPQVRKLWWNAMGASALTLRISTNKPSEAVRRICANLSRLTKPAGIIGFATEALSSSLQALVEELSVQQPRLPGLFAISEEVFTNEGELDGQDGLVCLLMGGRALEVQFDEAARAAFSERNHGDGIQSQLRRSPRLLLTSNRVGLPEWCPSSVADAGWFGAVSTSDAPLWGITSAGRVQAGDAAVVEFPALETPLVVTSPCCRLITQPLRVSSAEGNTVFELDGVPALVALGQASSKLVDRSWIVVATSEEQECIPNLSAGTPNLVFRPVRGIDPARGAIVLTEAVGPRMQLAFAVRDDRASRRSLEEALRHTKPRLYGAAPRFGIYFDGLGRGRSLYGATNVDLGLVRQALGDFPIVGMRSAFELRGDVPGHGTQSLTGQLALFRNPS